jgi:hypothetical protein
MVANTGTDYSRSSLFVNIAHALFSLSRTIRTQKLYAIFINTSLNYILFLKTMLNYIHYYIILLPVTILRYYVEINTEIHVTVFLY